MCSNLQELRAALYLFSNTFLPFPQRKPTFDVMCILSDAFLILPNRTTAVVHLNPTAGTDSLPQCQCITIRIHKPPPSLILFPVASPIVPESQIGSTTRRCSTAWALTLRLCRRGPVVSGCSENNGNYGDIVVSMRCTAIDTGGSYGWWKSDYFERWRN